MLHLETTMIPVTGISVTRWHIVRGGGFIFNGTMLWRDEKIGTYFVDN